MQPAPLPMPPRGPEQPPVVGPLPIPSVVRFPSVTLDHYGDGAGTTGAGLIWMGQLPNQYGITRYQDGDGKVGGPIPWLARITPHSKAVLTKGTLSYGPPGLHPGFNGFGLSFHPGYGYGGNGLGTGALGGYPCYGGPGYPLHYGYPKFAYPYYEGTAQLGQLYYDQPVVITDLVGARDFGPYTGASSYAYSHPSFASEAASTGSFVPGEVSFPDTTATNTFPEATLTPPETAPTGPGARAVTPLSGRFLGMDLEPGATADGRSGLKVVHVLTESTAAKAGLEVGDIILSINAQTVSSRVQLLRATRDLKSGSEAALVCIKATTGQEMVITVVIP